MRTVTLTAIVVLVTLGMVAGTATVAAQPDTDLEETPTIQCDGETGEIDVDYAVDLYNENTDSVPSLLQGVIASNTTELQIEDAEQDAYTLQTDGSMEITDVELGSADDPDVIVQTNRETACVLATADDPIDAFNTAYENDEVTVEGQGTVESAKVYVVEIAMEVMNFLS